MLMITLVNGFDIGDIVGYNLDKRQKDEIKQILAATWRTSAELFWVEDDIKKFLEFKMFFLNSIVDSLT